MFPRLLMAMCTLLLSGLAWSAPVDVAGAEPGVGAAERSVVVVDTGVEDWRTLTRGISAEAKVVRVKPHEDGLAALAEVLRGRSGIRAIHIISHGESGVVRLGASRIDARMLDSRLDDMAGIRDALVTGADIFLAGCNVAQGERGRRFVQRLAALSGADVAASTNPTGSSAKAGDWELEYIAGRLNSSSNLAGNAVLAGSELDRYDGVLATAFTSSKDGGSNPLSGIPDTDVGVITGDFDTDGDVDVLAFDDDTYSSTTFYRNDGSGNFSAVTGSANPFDGLAAADQFYAATNVYVADFDNDGDVDIWDYQGSSSNDGASMYLENTDGSTYASSLNGGSNPLSGVPDPGDGVVVGDFDTDGDVDVLAFDDDTYSSATFYRNDGSGNFAAVSGSGDPFDGIAAADQFYVAGNTYVADFDNDGDADIWDYQGSSSEDGTSIYLENTDGSTYASSLNGGNNPLSGVPDAGDGVVVGDFDTDGDVDVLAFDDETYSSTTFYRNDGSGNFAAVLGSDNPFDGIAAADQFYVAENTYIADFDSDGDVDAWDYEGSSTGDGISIYLEQLDTPPTILSSTPSDNATGVSTSDSVVITFDESVQLGSGNIEIRQVTDDTPVATATVSGGSVSGGNASVSLSTTNTANDTVTITPDSALPDTTDLYVHVDPPALSDSADGAAALSLNDQPSTLNFTTATGNSAPAIDLDTSSGGNDHTTVFSENTDQGTANADGTAVTGTVAASDADGTIETASLTLDNAQGDTGEGLSIDTAPLASALGFSTSATQITIARNSATNAELVEAIEAVRYQNNSDTPDTTSRTVTVVVTDDQSATATASSTITVEPGNDAPTITAPGGTLQPDEDASFDLSGANEIQIADVDAGGADVEVSLSANNGTLTFGSSAGLDFDSGANGTGSFTVSGTSFALNTALATLAYQGNADYFGSDTINATVNDRGNTGTDPGNTGDGSSEADSTSVALDVQPVPDAPTISAIVDQSTDEDTTLSGIAFTVDDAETAPGSLTLSFSSDTPSLIANHTFGGSGENRTLEVTPAADANGSAVITVEVSDGSLTTSEDFQFTVNAVNDLPTVTPAISTLDTTVDEDAAVPSINLTVEDVEDGGAGVTVTASSDNQTLLPDANLSVTDNGGGNRTLGVTLASDENGSANITVTLDDGTDTVDDSFTLTVNPQNDAPTVSLDQNSDTIAENNGGNVTVAQITIDDDGEAGSNNNLSLTGPDAGHFAINGSNLDFTGSADFETKDTYDVTVEVDDPNVGGTPDDAAGFTLNISDVDETPTFSASGPFSVSESAGNGTAVGDVDAVDGDGGATDANLTYSIVGGNTGGAFAIDGGTGAITVADDSAVDYDASASFTLDIEADDGTNAPTTAVTINVSNVAPTAPVDSDGASGGSVAEDAANGTAVGITADASDPGGGNVSYALTDDAGGRFQINAGTGIVTVADSSLIDYESANSHSISVRASDNDGADSPGVSFTIAVTDVDSAPVFSATGPFDISEAAGDDEAVGDVDANDGDGGGTDAGVSYAITAGNGGGAFAIDNNGAISVADASLVDYESSSAFSLTVEADDGALTASTTVTVNVVDRPPGQPVDANGAADSVDEGVANGTAVGVVAEATDPSGGAVTYALINDAGGRFAIDSGTGEVTVANGGLIDFESQTSHTIEIEARDADGTGSDSLTVNIAVTGVDEAPDLVTPPDLTGADAIGATGLYTAVNLESAGAASATDPEDGALTPSPVGLNNPAQLRAGTHTIEWSVTDSANATVTANQTVEVRPRAGIGPDRTVQEGTAIEVPIELNGDPVGGTTPTIDFGVAGTGSATPVDYAGLGAPGSVTMLGGSRTAVIGFDILNDGVSGEAPETLVLELTGTGGDTVLAERTSTTTTIVESNTPPSVSLRAEQSGVDPAVVVDGSVSDTVTVTAQTLDATTTGNMSFIWNDGATVPTDLANDADPATFEFDPSTLSAGNYEIRVAVTDQGTPQETGYASLRLKVVNGLTALGAVDTDGDGVDDASEGRADEDMDGLPDYRDPHFDRFAIHQRMSDPRGYLVETAPGLNLTRGPVAFAEDTDGARVSAEQIDTVLGHVDEWSNVGGHFDFEVHRLPAPGQTVDVVIPQRTAVPEEVVYRVAGVSSGWRTLTEDADNALASAPGQQGFCPPPDDPAYTAGLNAGDWCVRLTLRDGGTNDGDAQSDGRVHHLGGVAVESGNTGVPPETGEDETEVEGVTASNTGSSAFAWPGLLLLLAGLIARHAYRTTREAQTS